MSKLTEEDRLNCLENGCEETLKSIFDPNLSIAEFELIIKNVKRNCEHGFNSNFVSEGRESAALALSVTKFSENVNGNDVLNCYLHVFHGLCGFLLSQQNYLPLGCYWC